MSIAFVGQFVNEITNKITRFVKPKGLNELLPFILIHVFFCSFSKAQSQAQLVLNPESSTYQYQSFLNPILNKKAILQPMTRSSRDSVTTHKLYNRNASSGSPLLSQLHVGFGIQQVLAVSPVSLPYKPNVLGRVSAGFNYWHGYLKVNLSFAALEKFGDYPDCNMFDYSLSYHFHQKIYRKISLFIAPQLGFNTIHFEFSNYSADRLVETETSSAISIGIQNIWHDRFGVSLSYNRHYIFSTPRNSFSTIDVGLSYFLRPNKNLHKWLS